MKYSSHLLLHSRAFWSLLTAFVLANAWSWVRHRVNPLCCDQEITVGFPFPFHISGGITGSSNFYILGLMLNILVAWTSAVILVWIIRILRNARD